MRKPLPTQKRLLEVMEYNPETGSLVWLHREDISDGLNKRFAGKEAFNTDRGNGYLFGTLDFEQYLKHRVIWKMVTGRDPDVIDHVDGDPKNNRWDNLRNGDFGVNNRNMKKGTRNTSGHVGVAWDKRRSKWRVHIMKDGKSVSRRFIHKEQALSWRKSMEEKLGFTERHGA